MGDRPDFDKAQNEATNLLLHQNLTSLFIDVRKFRFDKPIFIDSVQNYSKIVGKPLSHFTCDKFNGSCVIRTNKVNLVLYDETEPNKCRKHWGIAHEIGHIYLNHYTDGEREEKEAHFFAAQVIMPEVVMYNICDRCGTLYPETICKFCNASYESATKRINTFERRGCFSYSKDDGKLLAKFRPILDKHFPNEKQKNWWDKLCYAG